ncbi:Protein penguin-like protein [Operophtera brumata]|uniref:Protein penguin-like protein n=1 Tax=Operophtera brumata TaxID=104452 RepID=A0A0L7LL06_OPEBR|nr:Protein penguin-like protein [Operophtera brumata]
MMQKVKRKIEDAAGSPKKKKFNPKSDIKGNGDEKKVNIKEKKKNNFGDKTKQFGDKTKNFGDKPKNFADKKKNFIDKTKNFGDKNKFADRKNFGDRTNKFNKFGDKNKKFGDKKDFKKDWPKNNKFGDKKDGFKGKFGKPGQGKPGADAANGEKPVWSEMKKEKKELRIVRRKAKATAEVFEISHKAKLLAAQIQKKTVKAEFRENSCKELHGILKGQYKSIALTHDLSRVIQVLLKHSSEDIKTQITEELLDLMVQMAQSKYGHHAVKRILKYGTDYIRHEVLKKFLGHIVSLATHNISAPVLDYAYGEFATKKEKCHMQQDTSPEMKPAILSSCQANIQKMLDKNLHDGELLHSVLYDYIRECSPEQRAELISTLSPLIVPLSNSLPGTILKVVKEHAVPLSKHKTGYRLLIAIFDSVDDTVLVKKAIVSTLAANLKDIAKDHWGNMPRDPAAFHPTFTKFLEEGARSGTSKKDAELRVAELREAVLPPLKKDLQEEPASWLSSKTNMLLAIAPEWRVSAEGGEALAVEEAGIHMCLKKLAQLDMGRADGTLGAALAERLHGETSNSEQVASALRKKLKPHAGLLKQQTTPGAKLLLQSVLSKI